MRACFVFVCVTTLVVLVQGLSDADKQRIKDVHSTCQSNPATHIDEEILKKLNKGEHVDKSVVGPHILCMSTNLGLLNAEGKINKDNLRKGLAKHITDEAKLNEAVDKCNVEKESAQDTALALLKCYKDNTDQSIHGEHHH